MGDWEILIVKVDQGTFVCMLMIFAYKRENP